MKPEDALIELLDRVGANQGAAVLVNDDELLQWPSEAVKVMQSQRLVAKCERKSNREPLVAVQKGPTWFKK